MDSDGFDVGFVATGGGKSCGLFGIDVKLGRGVGAGGGRTAGATFAGSTMLSESICGSGYLTAADDGCGAVVFGMSWSSFSGIGEDNGLDPPTSVVPSAPFVSSSMIIAATARSGSWLYALSRGVLGIGCLD